MGDLRSILLEQAAAFSMIETTAVLLAIAYLLLAIRQNIWCWMCAGLSTAIYVVLFAEAHLYMEAVLNGFYFAMAIYGWYKWTSGTTGAAGFPVVVWSPRLHVMVLVLIVLLSGVTGFALSRWTNAAFPYMDSLTTYSAIWATYLVARKVLENWWYWLVIDLASIFIYWSRDLQLTALLFILYVVLIPVGYLSWRASRLDEFVSADVN